jgi:hypothetical protein
MKDIFAVKPVTAMIEGGSGVTVFYSPATDSDMLAGYTVVPRIGWGGMVSQPMSDLEERAGGPPPSPSSSAVSPSSR